MDHAQNQTPIEELLPWHKPELQCLVVNIDTGDAIGSGVDLQNNENP